MARGLRCVPASGPAPVTTPGRNGSFRRVVLVPGPPGSGKTTLAGPLADLLGFPLIGKDWIKE